MKAGTHARPQERNPRKDLVHQELLNKAAQLFFDHGYANTRMQDIADAIGISRPALYHYFKNKDEVLIALTEGEALSHVRLLEDLIRDSNLSARQRLSAAIRANLENKLEGGARFRFADRIQSELPAQLVASFAKSRRRVFSLYVEIIQQGIETGEFREVDAKIIAFSVLGMVNWTAWWYSPSGRKSASEIADDMTELVVRGIVRHRGGQTSTDAEFAESALRHLEQAAHSLKRALRREIRSEVQ